MLALARAVSDLLAHLVVPSLACAPLAEFMAMGLTGGRRKDFDMCGAMRCGAVPCAESRTRVLERQQQQQQQQQQDPPNHGFALREPAREQNLEAKKARRRTHSGDTRRRTPINYGWGEGGHTRRAPGPPALRGGLPPGYYVSNQGQSNRLQVEGWSVARRPRTEDGAGSLPSVM